MSRRRIASQQATTVGQVDAAIHRGRVLSHLYNKALHDIYTMQQAVPDHAIVTVRIEFETDDEA